MLDHDGQNSQQIGGSVEKGKKRGGAGGESGQMDGKKAGSSVTVHGIGLKAVREKSRSLSR